MVVLAPRIDGVGGVGGGVGGGEGGGTIVARALRLGSTPHRHLGRRTTIADGLLTLATCVAVAPAVDEILVADGALGRLLGLLLALLALLLLRQLPALLLLLLHSRVRVEQLQRALLLLVLVLLLLLLLLLLRLLLLLLLLLRLLLLLLLLRSRHREEQLRHWSVAAEAALARVLALVLALVDAGLPFLDTVVGAVVAAEAAQELFGTDVDRDMRTRLVQG
jgi:hypothetical protein